MAKRKLLIAVTVARGVKTVKNSRGGETHTPKEVINLKAGDVFDFTEAEIADIEAGHDTPFATTVAVELTDDTVVTGEVKSKTPPADGSGSGEL